MKTLVIIPAYNEAASIAAVIRAARKLRPAVDVLVVNDGSADDTAAAARACGAAVIDLPGNLGIGGAMQTGYLYAWRHGYETAVQVDGDGQHDPAQIPLLLAPLRAGRADLALGSRFLESGGFQSSFARRLGIRVIRALLAATTGRRFSDPTSGFRAANRRVLALFAAYYPHDYPEPESLVTLARHRMRIEEVKVAMHPRRGGVSSILGWRVLYYMFKVSLAIVIEGLRKHRPLA